jgi:hypothetical protein
MRFYRGVATRLCGYAFPGHRVDNYSEEGQNRDVRGGVPRDGTAILALYRTV